MKKSLFVGLHKEHNAHMQFKYKLEGIFTHDWLHVHRIHKIHMNIIRI